jgi:hypothetical protein
VIGYKCAILEKQSTTTKMISLPLLVLGKSYNEVYRNILPRHTRNGKRHAKTMWIKLGLSFVAS